MPCRECSHAPVHARAYLEVAKLIRGNEQQERLLSDPQIAAKASAAARG